VQNGMVVKLDQAAKMAGMNAQMGALSTILRVDKSGSTAMQLTGVGFQLAGVNDSDTAYKALAGISSTIARKLIPHAQKVYESATTATGELNMVSKTDEVVDVVSEAMETVKLSATVGRIASTAGVVAEVVGNLVQIGVSSALYAEASSYNAQFQKAVEAANKPVTVQDLRAMMNSDSGQFQVAAYMEAALVTGAPDPLSNPLTTARPTMSLSSILSITSKF
jgi:hypothetical protein